MRNCFLLLIVACSCWFSCGTPAGNEETVSPAYRTGVIQDTTSLQISQDIEGDTVSFSYAGFRYLKHNKNYYRFFAGELELTTGRVVCTDPLYREFGLPQDWLVAPGRYPVYLYFGLDGGEAGSVIYAELLFRDEEPAFWRLSTIPNFMLSEKAEKRLNGLYPVETGLSCFADFETFKRYEEGIRQFEKVHPEGNYYDSVLAPYFAANRNIPAAAGGEEWINFKPIKAPGNIIMFSSGGSDGLYGRFAGYDCNGNLVKLLTSFSMEDE